MNTMVAIHAEFDLGNGDGDYTDLDASLKPIFGVPSNGMLLDVRMFSVLKWHASMSWIVVSYNPYSF